VLDPPKFAPSAQHIDRAARAYKEINLVGMQLLRPGGLLFTYSCSGAISMELFQKIVAGAATDARSMRASCAACRPAPTIRCRRPSRKANI
jgi:23S rRNA (cytosine1962-C5)-methyltransferase